MSNDLTLQLEINAKEEVSKTLTQVTSATKSELTKVTKTSEDTNKKIKNSYEDTGRAIKAVSNSARNELQEVKNTTKKLDDEFKKLNTSVEKVGDKFQSFGKKAMVAGTALTAFGLVNVKTAADFEQGMNNVSTLIDTNVESLDDMKKQVLQIGKSSPKAISDLTDGLYSIRSAGISAADQFKVLKGSEMLSVAGLSSTAEAVDIATSAINAFNIKAEDQNKMYDTLFKVVKFGKTNISDFAQGFGSVAGVVSSAGIELDEYSAAVAAMTTTGLKATNAHTQMSAAISSLTRSSKEQTAIFNQLGAKSFKDLVKKSGGMVNAFKKINDAVKGDEAKMVALMGSVNGYKAVMGLTNTVNGKFVETLNDMRFGSDALSEAYQKQTAGFNNQLAILRNSLQKISIDMGNSLMPVFTKIVDGVKAFSDVLDKVPQGVKSVTAIGVTSIGALIFSVGALSFATGTLMKAVNGISKGYSYLFDFVAGKKGMLFDFIGQTAKLPKTGRLLSAAFSPSGLGLKSFAKGELFGSFASDMQFLGIRRFKAFKLGITDAKDGISAFFKAIPSNSVSTLNGIKNFFVSMPANVSAGFTSALTAIQSFSMQGFITSMKAGLRSFLLFSTGVLTNPVGLAITGIAVAAILIIKYWKPISAFFKGVFNGIKDGLAPLQPTFTAIGQAIKPVVDWVKKLFTPINIEGKKAESWGYKFGQGIAWAITKVVEACKWVKNLITLGGRLGGNKNPKITEVSKPDGSHADGLTRVPYDGYIAEVHKNESILTAKEADNWRNYKANGGSNMTINYSPVITLANASPESRSELMKELEKHKKELAEMLDRYYRQRQRGAYA
ncbi:MAG: phage tail tape measure protein [Candidatus Gastranaerophilales bacterium]|nr:phage tail tape measure protein [Candidatus Gastranaerophilales bacterium]